MVSDIFFFDERDLFHEFLKHKQRPQPTDTTSIWSGGQHISCYKRLLISNRDKADSSYSMLLLGLWDARHPLDHS